MMDPSYITINNCEFCGRSQMIQFIANTSTSIARDGHDITITNCNFHDISTRSSANESGAQSIAIRMYSNHHNRVGTNIGSEGIFRDITITDNHFSNITSLAIWSEPFIEFTSSGTVSYNIKYSEKYL